MMAGAPSEMQPRDLLDLVRLGGLMQLTSGSRDIKIGLIDGPVALEHPDLAESVIQLSGSASLAEGCSDLTSSACTHGTFVAGILSAKRGSEAPAICPGCTLIARPIFGETSPVQGDAPSATPSELAKALIDVTESGAAVVNLSIAIVEGSPGGEVDLGHTLDWMARKRIIVVAAGGNQGSIGSSLITRHPWVIPVVAYDIHGRVMSISNLGGSIGRRGVGAPGERVTSLAPNGGSLAMGGTSVATPFVTGTIALLSSCFPGATATEIKLAVSTSPLRGRSIVPPLLDANRAYVSLATGRG
jgi:subtilisin family serine protease